MAKLKTPRRKRTLTTRCFTGAQKPELKKELTTRLNKCLGVFVNSKYKTCIALERQTEGYQVLHITMQKGLVVERIPLANFEVEWRLSDMSSVSRAAKVYAEYSQYLGATDEALTALQQFISLTTQEVLMAKKKADERANPVIPASSAKGKALAKAAVAREAKSKEKKETQSSMFVKLIMDGKLTDSQIFAKVKEKFGLSDAKKSYVGFYRRQLKAKGQNPPEPKEEKSKKGPAKKKSAPADVVPPTETASA